MARYPGARWEPITGHTNGPMRSYLGVVLHVNDAQSYDLHDFFNNPANEVSSHFQVAKDGTVWQYIDTKNTSWCQKDGNWDYLSVESQGLAGELATAAQITAIGGILAWCKATHGIPLQLAEIPGQRGFGWHGMGAAHGYDWGHALCPGVRKNQRTAMLAAAHGTPPEDEGMAGFLSWDDDDQHELVVRVRDAVWAADLVHDGTTQDAEDRLIGAQGYANAAQSAAKQALAIAAATQSLVSQLVAGSGGTVSIDYARIKADVETVLESAHLEIS